TASALAYAGGFGLALLRRTHAPTDLARHGVLRTLFVLAMMPLARSSAQIAALPLRTSNPVFAAAFAIAFVVFTFIISAPVSAATFHISVLRIWHRIARDPRTWVVAIGGVLWATIARDPLITGPYTLGIAMWLPVVVAAVLLRTIDNQQAELHRLR